MCKFNGKEIRTQVNENGDVFYKLADVLRTLGYWHTSSPYAKQIAQRYPENVIAEPACGHDRFALWLNRDGLNALAAHAAQAPVWNNRSAEWGNFLRFLDAAADESVSVPVKVEPIATLFPKIDDLIEEYQKFRKQYSAMLDELKCLQEENARLKGIAERVKTAMAAAGF